jgi:lipopolysaccharide biosynthesis protein
MMELSANRGQNGLQKTAVTPRLIAFYLTQFHPFAENDAWWGKGFTEWTNVTKARPLFDGHDQPHLPTDFGFYDLRVKETRHDQIRVAKQFGIDGFCYHYYWFSGTRLLNQPLDDMLADPESDMPFCLCWANENWTRRWDAAEHEILIAQRYLADDDLNFIKGLVPFFSDSRYIRIDGKPFLIVYRPQHLPDAKKTARVWRDYCRTIGIGEIHLCAALTHGNEDYIQFGFDCGVEFPPHNMKCQNVAEQVPFYEPFRGSVIDYEAVAKSYIERQYNSGNVHRTVFPSWDNTPRTGNRSVIVLGGTPANYEFWLAESVNRTRRDFPGRERLVFINAWNEWAEGCHLEPDRKFGTQFLEATLRVKNAQSTVFEFSKPVSDPLGQRQQRTLSHDLRWVLSFHWWIALGKIASRLKRYPRLRVVVRWIISHT